MSKLNDKIMEVKYERKMVKNQILACDKTFKKSRPELSELESDLDEDLVEQKMEEKEKERVAKLLVKENEKRAAEGEELLLSLPEKDKKVAVLTLERLEKKLVILNEKIQNNKMQMVDKDENKQTALGTSKINYIDPRISAAWCSKYKVPLEKIFTKTLRDKFQWAMETDKDFVF